MKKTSVILLLLLCLFKITSAQKVNFGLKMGYTTALLLANLYGQDNIRTVNNIDAGAFVNITHGHFTIQPGLVYVTKGGGTDSYAYLSSFNSTQNVYSTVRVNYLQLPINFLFNINLGGAGNLYMGGGPYLAMGLSGKNKYYITSYGNSGSAAQSTKETDVVFGQGDGEVRKADYGVQGLVSFKFNNGIDLGLGASVGASNVYHNYDAKNFTFGVTLGYFFQ